MRFLSDDEIAKREPIFISATVSYPSQHAAAPGRPPTAAAAGGGAGGGQDESFGAKVTDLQNRRNLTRGQAVKAAAAERPDLHAQHLCRFNAQAVDEAFRFSYVTGEPANFAEAVNIMLGAGHDPREAVRLAAARYPELYQARQRRIAELLK